MSIKIKGISGLFGAMVWISGIILAGGFWSTLFAIICPLWGLFLLTYRLLQVTGLIL